MDEKSHGRALVITRTSGKFRCMRVQVNGSGKDIPGLEEVIVFLKNLALSMHEQEQAFGDLLREVNPHYQISARNLLHYLVLRSVDIRPLQQFLHDSGLSSLTSSESHTLAQLLQVIRWLDPQFDQEKLTSPTLCNFKCAMDLRKKHLIQLLGVRDKKKLPHIMVTLSPELAADTSKIADLLKEGMTVARINCAHENSEAWLKMITSIRDTAAKVNKACKIYMDLGGPKIRVSGVPIRSREKLDGLKLSEGDIVQISEKISDCSSAKRRKDKSLKTPPTVVIQPEGIISMMKVGERIFFDDGKFEAKILFIENNKLMAGVTRISTRKPVLRAGKGVNLPDSHLTISSLTTEDLLHLPFIAKHADLVGYSFVSSPGDLINLRSALATLGENGPAIILKIERHAAVQNLPALLLEGMKEKNFGVMIARGDLAVEIGFERMSEIQQEILWICEAAHVPVIWATQVLENMNKTGFATRSEITDAAMGGMAECVMLNKGQHVVKTVRTLVDILTRFAAHVDKKRFTFRPLSIATSFLQGKHQHEG